METEKKVQRSKIEFYVSRSFGAKVDASFKFIKENWKVLLKFTAYLMLPICLIQAWCLNGLIGNLLGIRALKNIDDMAVVQGFGISLILRYVLFMLVIIVGSLLLVSMIFALIKTYNERDERLVGLRLKDIKILLFHNLKRMVILMIFSIILVALATIILVLLMKLSLFTLILTLPVFVAFSLPLVMLVPIYLMEDISIFAAFKRTYKLGFATWGGLFLMLLLMSIVANVLQGVATTPWYVATAVKYFFMISDTGSSTSVSMGYNLFLYFLGLIQAFCTYLSMFFVYIGLAYQYSHASMLVNNKKEEVPNRL